MWTQSEIVIVPLNENIYRLLIMYTVRHKIVIFKLQFDFKSFY